MWTAIVVVTILLITIFVKHILKKFLMVKHFATSGTKNENIENRV